jgi:hypothetical protein
MQITSAVSALALSRTILAQEPAKPVSANDRIHVACIGFGIMGQNDVRTVSSLQGVELVAVADVYEGRLTLAKERYGKGIFTTRDYREVLNRPDVDAVIVATPDHWHGRIATDAMKAGKDVYCQKPMVKKVEDGHMVIDAKESTGRILQVGSQRVSSILYAKAKELIHSGAIGEVHMIEAFWNRNSAPGAWQYSIPPDASEQTIDWERFLGSAPKAAIRASTALPLAQLSGLWDGNCRRSVRAPVQRDSFRDEQPGSTADLRHWRNLFLEGRPRCAGSDDGSLRLSRHRSVSGISDQPASQF